jgi:hypothetical protein
MSNDDLANELAIIKIAYANCVNDLARTKTHELIDELAITKIAYANCVNDLARTKAHLKQAEETLFALSQLLLGTAHDIQAKRVDNPGTGGSGGV